VITDEQRELNDWIASAIMQFVSLLFNYADLFRMNLLESLAFTRTSHSHVCRENFPLLSASLSVHLFVNQSSVCTCDSQLDTKARKSISFVAEFLIFSPDPTFRCKRGKSFFISIVQTNREKRERALFALSMQ
jgi:hypothetical protein